MHVLTSGYCIQTSYKGDRKRKETRGDTDGTIILFLIPWFLASNIKG